MIFIYTVFPNKEEAKKIAKVILEKKMAVCVNMWSVGSMYLWEGKVKEGEEVVCVFKTLKQNYKRIKKEIELKHSYEVPFIASVKINQINGPFYHYLKKNVKRYYGKKSSEAKPNLRNPVIRRQLDR